METRLIGRADMIDLPKLKLVDVPARIDTGAYGNALHCHEIRVVRRGGKDVLHFQVLDPSHPEFREEHYYAREFRIKSVKNSAGQVEDRYAIKTSLRIFGKRYRVEFSLTNRMEMKFPVLIGRKFLKRKFIVDVTLKNLSHKEKTGVI